MKKLLVVRHCNYDSNDHLNEYGKEQAKELAEALYKQIGNGPPLPIILSSDVTRALETARIIAKKFGTTITMTHRVLACSGISRQSEIGKVYRLVKYHEELGVENLILVTHEMQATFLPAYFGEKDFGLNWKNPKVEMATGWVIDCEKKTLRMLP